LIVSFKIYIDPESFEIGIDISSHAGLSFFTVKVKDRYRGFGIESIYCSVIILIYATIPDQQYFE
jgi:hypothetical protein